MTRTARTLLGVVLVGVVLFVAGCPERRTIAEIQADPGRYTNREVGIEGTVSNSFGAIVGPGVYEVDDGTGKLWVVSERGGGVPSRGARVRVAGTVATGVTIGGRSFGVILRESDRDTRNVR